MKKPAGTKLQTKPKSRRRTETFVARYTAQLSEEAPIRASSPAAALAIAEKMVRNRDLGSDMTLDRNSLSIRLKSSEKAGIHDESSEIASEITSYLANELEGGFVTQEGNISFTWNGRACSMSIEVLQEDPESSSSMNMDIPEYERTHNMLR